VVLTGGDENVRASVALAAMLSGSGVRGGINVAPPLIHLPVDENPSLSNIANKVRIVELLGHPGPGALEPRVCFRPADLRCTTRMVCAAGRKGGRAANDVKARTRRPGGYQSSVYFRYLAAEQSRPYNWSQLTTQIWGTGLEAAV
jgi:hypothetical protein